MLELSGLWIRQGDWWSHGRDGWTLGGDKGLLSWIKVRSLHPTSCWFDGSVKDGKQILGPFFEETLWKDGVYFQRVGGREFIAEHSGYEQTNCRVLDTLQNVGNIQILCLPLPQLINLRKSILNGKVYSMSLMNLPNTHLIFSLTQRVRSGAPLTYSTSSCLNVLYRQRWFSQMQSVQQAGALDAACQWIHKQYGVYGRFSAESHESVHTRFDSINNTAKRMASRKKWFDKFCAQATVDLKKGELWGTSPNVKRRWAGEKEESIIMLMLQQKPWTM